MYLDSQTINLPPFKHKWIILGIAVMLPFMTTIDIGVVNVALPLLADSLHVSSSSIAWISTVYLISAAASLLLFGRLGDIFGQHRIFKFGIMTFTIGSLFCSLSTSFAMLVGARIIQALGGSMAMSTNQAILTKAFPKNEWGRALGINGTFVALGTMIGPPLGGLILSVASWPYLFWINVPIGLIVLVAGFLLFPKEKKNRSLQIDVSGTVLMALAIVSFFYALQETSHLGLKHPLIVVCLLSALVLFAFFIRQQSQKPHPLLNLDLFKNPQFSISLFCGSTSYLVIACFNLVHPFFLQDVLGMSPAQAGLFIAIYPLAMALVSPFSGWIANRIGAEKLTILGLAFVSTGLFLLAFFNSRFGLLAMALMIMLIAVGNGLFQAPNNTLVMSSVLADHLGVGGSINALVRNIGQATGTTLSTTLLYFGMSQYIHSPVTNYVAGNERAFIFGMKWVYLFAGTMGLIGVVLTVVRHRTSMRNKASRSKN